MKFDFATALRYSPTQPVRAGDLGPKPYSFMGCATPRNELYHKPVANADESDFPQIDARNHCGAGVSYG
jgi:hypothetical protein